jgi:hypothetical protein
MREIIYHEIEIIDFTYPEISFILQSGCDRIRSPPSPGELGPIAELAGQRRKSWLS